MGPCYLQLMHSWIYAHHAGLWSFGGRWSLSGVGQDRGLRGGEEGGGGPGEARTILLLHIISVRPSKQPLMVRTSLKVSMELGLYFVSARTNKRHNHLMGGVHQRLA
jgi:hypothetical protein